MDRTILSRAMANKVMGMAAITPTGLRSIITRDGDR